MRQDPTYATMKTFMVENFGDDPEVTPNIEQAIYWFAARWVSAVDSNLHQAVIDAIDAEATVTPPVSDTDAARMEVMLIRRYTDLDVHQNEETGRYYVIGDGDYSDDATYETDGEAWATLL